MTTTTTTTTGMYAGWSPAPSLEEHLPIENVEAVGILSPEIICNLIGDISKCLSNPLQVEQMYSTETGLRWILQVMSHSLLLPMQHKSAILESLTIYRHWLGTLSGERITEIDRLALPVLVLTRPEKFAKIALCHLPNLFILKEYSPENSENEKEDHVKLCEAALRSIHCVGTGTGGDMLSQSAWTTLLTSLIEIGDKFLPLPSKYKDLAFNICAEFIRILFDLWVRSCAHHFPSPPLWSRLKQSCMNWRHRIPIITQWDKMINALTKAVVLELNPQNQETAQDAPTGRPISGIEWRDTEFRSADFYLEKEPLYQCWYRFLHTIGNVVELSYPDVILRQFDTEATEVKAEHKTDLLNLQQIFWIAFHSIDQQIDLFLTSNSQKDTAIPHKDSTTSTVPVVPNTPVPTRSRGLRGAASLPSSTKNIKASLSAYSTQNINATPTSRFLSPSLLYQTLSTAQLQAKASITSILPVTMKTSANTLLHIFGAWLFEACIWKYNECLNEFTSPPTHNDALISPSQIAMKVFDSQSQCLKKFEAGRAEAFSALCKIFCRQPCKTPIKPEYLSRFYASMIRGLSFQRYTCTGEVVTKIIEEGNDLLRIDLPVSSILLPHFLNMLETILPLDKPPFACNFTPSKSLESLRAKAINILSSMICFPLHFQHLPIIDLSRFVSQERLFHTDDIEIAPQGCHITYLSLRDRITKLLFDAIFKERDAINICTLLSLLQVALNDSSSYDNCLARDRKSNLKEYFEDDVVSYRVILSTKQTYTVFVEACHIAINILQEWNFRNGNLDVILASFELLNCVARIRIEDIDIRTRSEVLICIHEFILPPPSEDSTEQPQYKQQTRDRHTQLVAAFNTVQQWLLAYPGLLKEEVCLKRLMEIIETGLSGFPSQKPNSDETIFKEDKIRGYPSTRVLEAAEALLTTAVEIVNSFPSPSGPETPCSLLDEETILECLAPEMRGTCKFKYYVLNNSIIIGLLSGPFSKHEDTIEHPILPPLPTVTMVLRCVTGKHVWTFQMRHFPRGKTVDPTLLKSADRPHLGEVPQVVTPAETTPWPEPNPADEVVGAELSIPTVTDILEKGGIREESKEFLEFVDRQREAERVVESLTQEKKANQIYPDPDLIAEPDQPKTDYQADRLLLNSLGLLQTGHLAEMDSSREGFKRALQVLDNMPVRNSNTVFLLYVQSGRTSLMEVVDYKPQVMRNNSHFYGFLQSLGWPRNPTTHVGFRGKVPLDKSFFTPKLSPDRHFLYYTDQVTEIAFVFPEPLESMGSSVSLMSSDSYESLSIGDVQTSYPQSSRTPPENLSINTDPGSIPHSDKDSSKVRTPKKEHCSLDKEDSVSNNSSTSTPNFEIPKLSLPMQRQPTPSLTQEMMTSGGEASIFPNLKVSGVTSDRDIVAVKPTSRKRQKQHCGTIVVWLECFEDHISFPIQQIVELFLLDTYVTQGGKRRLNTSQNSFDRLTNTPPVIFIYRLQNGLFRIHRPGPLLPTSPTATTTTPMPAGPLLNGFTCGPRDLARLVRETTINICWEHRLSGDEYSPPEFLRRRRIEDIVQIFKLPNDTQSKLITRLFM